MIILIGGLSAQTQGEARWTRKLQHATPFMRPLVFRSDALTHGQIARLKKFSENNLLYTAQGYLKTTPKMTLKITNAAWKSMNYGRAANKALYKSILKGKHPKDMFSIDDIKRLMEGRNPEGYKWHHSEKPGILELVDQKTHSKSHIGGGKTSGPRLNAKQYARNVACNWAKIALIDIAVSSSMAYYQGEFDAEEFAFILLRVGTSAVLAAATEYTTGILIRMAIGTPAAIVATVVYISTSLVFEYIKTQAELEQLQRQENMCRNAEKKARWIILQGVLEKNNNLLDISNNSSGLNKCKI